MFMIENLTMFSRFEASTMPLLSVTENLILVGETDAIFEQNKVMFVHILLCSDNTKVRLRLEEWVGKQDEHIIVPVKHVRNTTNVTEILLSSVLGTEAVNYKSDISEISVEDILNLYEQFLNGDITLKEINTLRRIK